MELFLGQMGGSMKETGSLENSMEPALLFSIMALRGKGSGTMGTDSAGLIDYNLFNLYLKRLDRKSTRLNSSHLV